MYCPSEEDHAGSRNYQCERICIFTFNWIGEVGLSYPAALKLPGIEVNEVNHFGELPNIEG